MQCADVNPPVVFSQILQPTAELPRLQACWHRHFRLWTGIHPWRAARHAPWCPWQIPPPASCAQILPSWLRSGPPWIAPGAFPPKFMPWIFFWLPKLSSSGLIFPWKPRWQWIDGRSSQCLGPLRSCYCPLGPPSNFSCWSVHLPNPRNSTPWWCIWRLRGSLY